MKAEISFDKIKELKKIHVDNFFKISEDELFEEIKESIQNRMEYMIN